MRPSGRLCRMETLSAALKDASDCVGHPQDRVDYSEYREINVLLGGVVVP